MRMLCCGLPGVGKDYLLDRVRPGLEEHDIEVVSFGEMLFQELAGKSNVSNRDELSGIKDSAKEEAVRCCVGRLLLAEGNLVVSSHLVRINTEGTYAGTDSAIRLQPSYIACITADPSVIAQRTANDTTRNRVLLEESSVRDAQDLQASVVEELADKIGLGYSFIDNSLTGSDEPVERLRETIMGHNTET